VAAPPRPAPWTKRHPAGLTPPARADFLREQAKWDRKLKASGFVDIEAGFDLGEHATSSMRHAGVTPASLTSADLDRQHESVWQAPEASYWRTFAAAAEALPANYRGRAFLARVAAAGALSADVRGRLSDDAAERAVRSFCARCELPYPCFRSSPGEPDPELCHACPPRYYVRRGKRVRMWHAPHGPVRTLRPVRRQGAHQRAARAAGAKPTAAQAGRAA
jgi:hypothetical protein